MSKQKYLTLEAGQIYLQIWDSPDTDAAAGRAPILLFHDSLGAVAMWRSFPQALAQASGRRVIAYDRLGFGLSDARTDQLEVNFIRHEAEVVVPQICTQLGITHFIACGHSVGGGIAITLAAQMPDACAALITIAAQAVNEPMTRAGIAQARADFQNPQNLARLARYHGDKARWVVDAWTETWLSPAFKDWNLDAEISRIRCPVLVLHGNQDEYGSAAQPARIAQSADARLRMLPTGHVPHRENEPLLVREIVQFLVEQKLDM